MDLKEILEYTLLSFGEYSLTIGQIGIAVLILFVARILVWLINSYLVRSFFKRKSTLDLGRKYAVRQFTRYIIYFIALLMVLESIGIQMSVIWAGSAALLFGAGLGLQQAVSDLISGLILLGEGTVEVGDVVVVDNIVGRVTDIGIRTSKVTTRDDVEILIPNSKLVMNNVINWSHNQLSSRFDLRVGVAYGSDVRLVTRLLKQAAKEHPEVLEDPEPRVQFNDFGNSSLDFRLLFYSDNLMPIEFVKSDLRYRIDELFRENKVVIPFPQRDLWIKNPETLRNKADQ